MTSFGQEQALLDGDRLRQWVYRLIGNPHPGSRLRLRSLLQAINFLKSAHGLNMQGAKVLDAGSGKGDYSFFLTALFLDTSVTGYELEGPKVERARTAARALGNDRVEFHQGSLTDLPVKNVFDLAMCLDVLEHIQDDQAAINSIFEALKPGGYFILHVPNLVPPRFDFVEEGHVRDGYDNSQMSFQLKDAGFEVLQIRNPIGFCGQWADSLCEVLSGHPIFRGFGITLYAVPVWMDRFGSQSRQFPSG